MKAQKQSTNFIQQDGVPKNNQPPLMS